jgi:hypothetical protein
VLLACAGASEPGLPSHGPEIQNETNWCGAKCLWLLAKGSNKPYSLEEVKAFCPAGQERDGVLSLDDLKQGAERCGLSAMVVTCKYDWLSRKGCPAITLHRVRGPTGTTVNHFVVCLSANPDTVRLIEPFASTAIQQTPRANFEKTWTGEALVIAESANDLPHTSRWYLATTLTAVLLLACGVLLAGKWKRRVVLSSVCLLFAAVSTGCSGGKAELGFDQLHHDFGVLWRDQSPERLVKRHSFAFANTSTVPVRITKAQSGCGCLEVDYPKEPIPPGGEGEVTLVVDLHDRLARFTTYSHVFLNDDESNPIELSVSSFVVGPVKVSPEQIAFGGIPAGTPTSRTLTVRVPLAPDEQQAKITECRGKKGIFRCELTEPKNEEASYPGSGIHVSVFTIKVTAAPKEVGTEIEDVLTIRLNKRPEPLTVRVHAWTTHPRFTVEPATVNLGAIGPSGVKRKSVIRSVSKAPPPVTAVTSSSPEVRAWLEKNPSNAAEMFLWVEALNGSQRFVEGTVTLTVDDAAFPEYPVRFAGYRIDTPSSAAVPSKASGQGP